MEESIGCENSDIVALTSDDTDRAFPECKGVAQDEEADEGYYEYEHVLSRHEAAVLGPDLGHFYEGETDVGQKDEAGRRERPGRGEGLVEG